MLSTHTHYFVYPSRLFCAARGCYSLHFAEKKPEASPQNKEVGPLTQLGRMEVESGLRQPGVISLLFTLHVLFPNLTPPPEKDAQTVRDELHGPVMESCVLGMGDREIPGQLEDVGWELHTQENLVQNKPVSASQTTEKLPGEGETQGHG